MSANNTIFLINRINLVFCLFCTALYAQANNQQNVLEEPDSTTLETIYVKEKFEKQKQNVSGLGEVRKNQAQIQNEQIENIRDITRYDPGISITEAGGRGTTRGFSIRGVDQDRVAIDLDGLGASSTLKRHDASGTFSMLSASSKNDVEYEDLRLLDLRKGASSAESGSGALGGAVSMETKNVDDFLQPDQSIGGRFKADYTSKDKRKLYSGGLAFRAGKFDGFVQYSHRNGHEVQAHKDLYKGSLFIANYADPVDPIMNKKGRWVSMEEVSGVRRRIPNPLDYESDSLLSKFGWHFTPQHYLGIVINRTKQQYKMREMQRPNYYNGREKHLINGVLYSESPFYDEISTKRIQYTPSQFYFDTHQNNRIGLEYHFDAKDEASWLNSAVVRFDKRDLIMQSEVKRLNCAKWPSVDANCWATEDGQKSWHHIVNSKQTDYRLDLNLNKLWEWGEAGHDTRVVLGSIFSKHHFYDYDRFSDIIYKRVASGPIELDSNQHSDFHPITPIKSRHYFIGISDSITLGEKWFISSALRYDHYQFKGNPTLEEQQRSIQFKQSKYQNLSWDFGVKYQIIEPLAFTYRNSSGFRVPSVYEQLGPTLNANGHSVQGKLDKEYSRNQEIGAEFEYKALRLKSSYFWATYKNMIALASLKQPKGQGRGDLFYYNTQDIKVRGYDISANLDLYSLWARFPEGLNLFAKISKTQQIGGPAKMPEKYEGRAYSLDSLQPLRLVYGLSYLSPEEKWGLSFVTTYSKGKDSGELVAQDSSPLGVIEESRSHIKTKSWIIADLTGHYQFNKYMTFRAGIYNLFNYRYVTWESARQTVWNGSLETNLDTPNYSVVAAPGRNFFAGLEIKF
ncbi:TonB-dependent hemoglobin/transferrin/lactoferrin family receptor [Avibacterium volantium]|uniref:Transferrin-binding protein 1 n=1 Tax=Avibacterium volantium TaxID=762 RepID=A0A3S4KWZ0_AVIVO|nr:TonB-dependent hemoglobin/transferrin/lactoferrin family receptor [Avibacterium volantium]VEB23492.1 Transferrin-binding protein 1 precursor [Avibacterium volantium]